MRFPVNHAYTDEDRLVACEVIFPGDQPNPLQHWYMFMSYPQTHYQSPVEQYTALRAAAFEWYTNYRIEALIKAVERGPDPRLFERP